MERNGRRIAARSRALVAKDVGDEVVLYDLDTDKVHLLDARASTVWRLAKEPIALDDLVTEATVHLAPDEPWREEILAVVDELGSHNLLDHHAGPSLLNRRRMLKLAGAAALAAPAITTVLAPPASAAHSGGPLHPDGEACSQNSHCVSGNCYQGFCRPCSFLVGTTGCGSGSPCCTGNPTGTICRSDVCCIGEDNIPPSADQTKCCSGQTDPVGGECCTPIQTAPPTSTPSFCCRVSGANLDPILHTSTGVCCLPKNTTHGAGNDTACCSGSNGTKCTGAV